MWHVVVPVKGGERAKSRLDLDPGLRRLLAAAMAADTIDAVHRCPVVARVTVLCGPGAAAALELPSGVATLGESSTDAPAGLNPQLARAVVRAGATGKHVAVVVADLPSLTAPSLAETLTAAHRVPVGLVVDRQGTGTTILTAREPALLEPTFGPHSATAHVERGAMTIDAGPELRCDVDTLADLDRALALGVGPRTGRIGAAAGRSASAAPRD